MKIIFVGTVEFSKRMLEKLIELDAGIVGIITKKLSQFHSDFASLGDIASQTAIECYYPSSINAPETLSWIRSKDPDYVFCFGWSELFKEEFLSIPRKGVIGYHPALLPQNRGRHPLIWALVLGLSETGSSFFFMDAGTDSGDILSQKAVEITYTDDAETLYEKITLSALSQIEEFLPALQKNNFRRVRQDHSRATYWRKRSKEDGRIDWRMSSYSIYNLVRALARPYPGAHLVRQEKEYKVWKVKEVQIAGTENAEPGKVLETFEEGSFLIKAGDNCIAVLEHEMRADLRQGDYLL